MACETGTHAERSGLGRRLEPRGQPSLKQWARLYRAASQVAGLDMPQLERLAQRVAQKPLAELSMLEAAGLIATFKASVQGVIDLKLVIACEFPKRQER